MSVGFYFKNAFRNIWNNKRQSSLYVVGIILSITVVSSLTIWSTKSEDFATIDFLNGQDYEFKVRSYLPHRLPEIRTWLDADPLIESTNYLYYNLAFFNAEEKDPFYRFWPLENQDDNLDPATLSTLFLFPKDSIQRFKNQFEVEGSWDLDVGEVLISKNQAKQIELAKNMTVQPGTVLNLTIARQSVDFGVYLFQYEPVNFYNITVKGIYTKINSISMLQQTFSQDFIENSIFFLTENMLESDIERYWDNGLYPLLAAKCKSESLADEGIANIVPLLENLEERLTIEITTAVVDILDEPFYTLEQSYSKAKTYIVIMIPVILLGIIQTIFSTNIILERRELEVDIYQEKGGLKRQIIGALLLEFTILSVAAIITALVLSWFVSSLIPSIASMSFNKTIFVNMLSSFEFLVWPIIVSTVAVIVTTLVYAALKINQLLSKDLSERDRVFKSKFQKWFLFGTLIALIVISIGVFIFLLIRFQNDIQNTYNYSIAETQDSSILFTILILIIILLAIGAAIGVFLLLGKMKKIYSFIIPKNSFFLVNSLKKSRFKFNSLIIVLLVLTSSSLYTLNMLKTVGSTQAEFNYYNNGSDLRITTYDAPLNFTNSLESIEGIDIAMPILQTSGKYGFQTVTIYGINVSRYAQIGRWLESSYPKSLYDNEELESVDTWLSSLLFENSSALIGDVLALDHSIELDDEVIITSLPLDASYGSDRLKVKGYIHSAPGLGLATGINLQLKQPSDNLMLVNDSKLIYDYGITTSKLFFASITEGADIEAITNQLLTLDYVDEVNPNLEEEGFADTYINRYVPSLKTFLLVQILLTVFIGIVIILMNTNFIFTQRKQNIAILNSLGNSNKNLIKMIFQELLVINLAVIIIGIIISLPFSLITTQLMEPFLVEKLIIPLSLSVDYLSTILFFVGLILISLCAAIPAILNDRRERIATAIQDETSSAY